MPPGAASMPAGLELIATLRQGVTAAEALLADARLAVAGRVMRRRPARRRARSTASSAPPTGLPGSPPTSRRSVSSPAYAQRIMEAGSLGEIEELLVRIGAGEYLAQMLGGIPMSQGEIVRLADLGLTAAATAARMTPAVEALIATGNTAPRRARACRL